MTRIFYIVFTLVMVFAVEAIAQSDSMPAKNDREPLAILDGKITTPAKVKQLGLSDIKGMWVIKDNNFPVKYGEAGRNGVVFISTQNTELRAADTATNTQPLILLDSVEIDIESMKRLPPANIDNVQVFKDKQATDRYGIKAAKGLVLVTSKKPVRLVSFATVGPNNPLLLIDGVEKDIKELENIKPESIEKLQVLKDVGATALYGIKGAHGVILVTTKNNKKTKK
ncbi:TonB-dependent receptor plug domain-containing protein [Mucilaginibacter defluvii]|uniref:TonB-dependent receptor plug domain-containing protein n=1 Tax=Mucilaginibacter defluvii TaxID=1196019 RepID=A0ABP9FY93_9SPHI